MAAPSERAPQSEVARVVTVPSNDSLTVLFSGPPLGILAHWIGKRNKACPGLAECPATIHRIAPTWYGYAPVRLWDPGRGAWVGHVLEVTESLEEQLRGLDLVGSVWVLARAPGKKRGARVEGIFVERRSEPALLAHFDVRPAVQRLYHTSEIYFGVRNPTPPKVMIEVAECAGPNLPKDSGQASEPPVTPEQKARLAQLAGKRLHRRAEDLAGEASPNGHPRNLRIH